MKLSVKPTECILCMQMRMHCDFGVDISVGASEVESSRGPVIGDFRGCLGRETLGPPAAILGGGSLRTVPAE